jgi:hypothetical protein
VLDTEADMNQLERPLYYEGEYLGADDLTALVRYGREAQARNLLGAHIWGIAIGLDLAERALTGDNVEVVLTPGIAWDGYARPLVALVPQRVTLDLFASFEDDTPPEGTPVEVWLSYRELPGSPPGVGFSCPDDDLHGRVVETFRIELRRAAVADYHSVSIASRAIEARNALKAFDPSRSLLYDESCPQQAFPDSDKLRWPVFAGIVRWKKDAGLPGTLIKRTDDDCNMSRQKRRYLGAVAEAIVAADGVLRLRDRSKDPNDPVVNYKAPIVAAPAGTSVINDLVWCEGHLRVVGDARLQDGALDYRVAKGSDQGVPVLLRRTFANAKTTLDAHVGPPAAAPSPATGETRFAVSTTDAGGNNKELLTVITDGRVGINAATPSNTLQVEGPTGIRHGFGYLTGDRGAAWTALTFNAFNSAAGWTNPDLTHKAAAVQLDDNGGAPQLTFQTSAAVNPPAWNVHLTVKGDTGNVGLSTNAPTARLHVQGDIPQAGTARFTPAPAKGGFESHIHWDPTGDWYIRSAAGTGKVVIQDTGGNVGIGTAAPTTKLHVQGDRIRLGSPTKRIDLRTDGAAVDLHSETDHLYIRTFGNPGKRNVLINPWASEGNVGIGTETPNAKLDIFGDMHLNGNQFLTLGTLWITSDLNQKENIKPIKRPLERLLALRGVAFNYREAHGQSDNARHLGFVAQDVQAVFPEMVRESPLGQKAVNATGMNAILVEALREMAERMERLEGEVTKLRQKAAKKGAKPRSAPDSGK